MRVLHPFPSPRRVTAHPKPQGQMETWTKRRQTPVHPADKSQILSLHTYSCLWTTINLTKGARESVQGHMKKVYATFK